jgi:hypothetical protein
MCRTFQLSLKIGRADVDPESDLQDTHHVFEDKATNTIYSVTLASSDVTTNRNSYYRIQLLESDHVLAVDRPKKRSRGPKSAAYYVFRKWGRIGTDIG